MLITIDTKNITQPDLAILAFILRSADPTIDTDTVVGVEPASASSRPEPEKPTRSRRTKLEITFDTAKEEHGAKPGQETWENLRQAYEELKAKDPENDRLKNFGLSEFQNLAEEPTPASEDAESDAAHPESDGAASISIQEVTELATQLIQSDRSAMVELLKQYGVRRVSEIPESDLGKFASEIRSKLA